MKRLKIAMDTIMKFAFSQTPAPEKSLTLHVYDQLKEMMFTGQIVPGQRLIFADLAKRLKVSRTPVNNALFLLAKEGYLDFKPNFGYTVHQMSKQELECLYDFRMVLELGSVKQAIGSATDEKLEQVKWCMERHETAMRGGEGAALFLLDQEFHVAIAAMAENPAINECLRDIFHKIFFSRKLEGLRAVGRVRTVVGEHNRIFDALSKRDVKRTWSLLADHIANGRAFYMESIAHESADSFGRAAG